MAKNRTTIATLSEKDVLKHAQAQGIPIIGFLSPDPLAEAGKRLLQREKTGKTEFERVAVEDRIDFSKAFEQVQTIIVFGVPYGGTPPPFDETGRGRIAEIAWGRDYHSVLKEKAEGLMADLTHCFGPIAYRIFIDNTRLVDRESAYAAGLGFFGKNNLMIHLDYGSFFNIGQILVDRRIDFKEKEPMASRCGTCKRCIAACPHKALGEGFNFKPNHCISYLTQKKNLTLLEEERVHTYLYGCDICQYACPFNWKVCKPLVEELHTIAPKLENFVQMTDDDYKKLYGHTSMGWRSLKIIQRNALLLNKNT